MEEGPELRQHSRLQSGRAVNLDELDHAIITCLRENVRMSSREIARRLGDVSDRVVRYRIRRLIDNHVVLFVVSPFAVGYPVMADIVIEVVPWKLEEVAAAAAKLPPVTYVSTACSSRHVSVEVNAVDEDEVVAFVNEQLRDLDGVLKVETLLISHLVKDVADWEIPERTG
ncbi:MAG: hypothetical protein BWY94_00991 [Actinobacteria bacterium ADurb.BinA094]|nr:Lrp/AsnC family transcriptional regulator [Acidobacteriota bacterium]OPZ45941.1 MAG: hypothetical protein BWY94_00991 [Actinobacteria bacterium ADurb.BinA094]